MESDGAAGTGQIDSSDGWVPETLSQMYMKTGEPGKKLEQDKGWDPPSVSEQL